MKRSLLLGLAPAMLFAAPAWKAPETLPFGELSVIELVEEDPTQPALPRPGDDKLGPLELRAVEANANGRGWKLTVQPLAPGSAVIPSLDLGDGRRTPELRINVPRDVPYGAPWQGHGGGQNDILPYVPFPWAWASLLLLPFLALAAWLIHRWRRGATKRALHQARRTFSHHWPPLNLDRASLDASHKAGRELLSLRFGEEARSWGAQDFQQRHLEVWATWIQSLDAARFARKDPPFPPLADLLKTLGERP